MANILDQMTPFNKVDTDIINKQIIDGIKHKMARQSERRARIIAHNKGVAQANADARAVEVRPAADARAAVRPEARTAARAADEKVNSKRIINKSFTIKNVDVF